MFGQLESGVEAIVPNIEGERAGDGDSDSNQNGGDGDMGDEKGLRGLGCCYLR